MINGKSPMMLSVVVVLLFLLMQFVFVRASSGGGWCSPYLDAPTELGHPAYQFSRYGFPIEFLTVAKEDCFTAQSTTYEWDPIGLIVDGTLLVLLALPLWRYALTRNPPRQL